MALQSAIEWTESTWNPVTGCTKISAGCAHCYAERMTRRLQAMGQKNYANVWMGVTVENAQVVPRIEDLRRTPARHTFLSCEPLLGPLRALDLAGIDWVIVGGESGPGARPMLPAWVEQIQQQCQTQNTPFFFKQWGGVRKKAAGRTFNGREWNEIPAALAVA